MNAAVPPRDPRLDFFRGVALILIVVAHVPNNPWWLYMPQRFGFSDAASIFVFCSGVTSALAFGATFARAGWLLGTLRIAVRVWQVYWVHIGSFVAIAAAMVWLNGRSWLEQDYIAALNLTPFFDAPAENLLGFVTLTYVPNYFDILPMYLVLLAMVPLVWGLAQVHRGLALLLVAGLYLATNLGYLRPPAEPWSDRPWYFNPFAWQAPFFIGFAMAMRWLPVPAVTPGRMRAAALALAASAPLAFDGGLHKMVPLVADAGDALAALGSKTTHGPLRLVHFLLLAYLAYGLAGPRGARLATGPEQWQGVVALVSTVGRHSLAIFAFGLLLSRLLGAGLDFTGRGAFAVAMANLGGVALVILVALFLDWLKSTPWRQRPGKTASPGRAGDLAKAKTA